MMSATACRGTRRGDKSHLNLSYVRGKSTKRRGTGRAMSGKVNEQRLSGNLGTRHERQKPRILTSLVREAKASLTAVCAEKMKGSASNKNPRCSLWRLDPSDALTGGGSVIALVPDQRYPI